MSGPLDPSLPLPPSPAWPARTTAELVGRKPPPGQFARVPRAPISVVLEDVRSLANVGLIFRLCDAVRVQHLYLCGITGHPLLEDPSSDPRPRHIQERAAREIGKTAVMAVPYVPWSYEADATAVVARLRTESNHQVVAVEQAHGSVAYTREGIYQVPVCLVLGHERAGVTPATLRSADLCVEVPVFGMANSLNVAMAFAVVAYEISRQHHGFGLTAM